jgi:hypothetical protein
VKGYRFFLAVAVVHLSIASTAFANIPVFEAYVGSRPAKEAPGVVAFLADLERMYRNPSTISV